MAASMMQQHTIICRISFNSIVRTISSSTCLRDDFNKSKTMQKIMKKANRKKDTRWHAPIYEQKSTGDYHAHGPARSKQKFSEGMIRRANYVGDVLYEAVSQIVSSGQLGVTPSITQVKILPDMSHMNIYWEASGNKQIDEQTQITLDQKVKFLRHILMGAQAVSNVPRPVFIKDISIARQKQVDEILHKISLENEADGDSESDQHEETDSEIESDIQLDLKKTKVFDEQDAHPHKDQSVENVETEFRQDLYDLQHDVLMKKVVSAKVSANQRPTVVSDPKSLDNNRKIEDKLKTKFFSPKTEVSRKKLLRRIEQVERYELETERFDEINDMYVESDTEEDFTRIDSYIERFSKAAPNDKQKDISE